MNRRFRFPVKGLAECDRMHPNQSKGWCQISKCLPRSLVNKLIKLDQTQADLVNAAPAQRSENRLSVQVPLMNSDPLHQTPPHLQKIKNNTALKAWAAQHAAAGRAKLGSGCIKLQKQ